MPYTSGTWKVKPGKEQEFIDRWGELAAWSVEEADGGLWAVLTQDEDDPQMFVSFGPWETREDIDAWRQTPEFTEAFADLRELIDGAEVHVLNAVFETARTA